MDKPKSFKIDNKIDGSDAKEAYWKDEMDSWLLEFFKNLIAEIDKRIEGYGKKSKEGLCLTHLKNYFITGNDKGAGYFKKILNKELLSVDKIKIIDVMEITGYTHTKDGIELTGKIKKFHYEEEKT